MLAYSLKIEKCQIDISCAIQHQREEKKKYKYTHNRIYDMIKIEIKKMRNIDKVFKIKSDLCIIILKNNIYRLWRYNYNSNFNQITMLRVPKNFFKKITTENIIILKIFSRYYYSIWKEKERRHQT